MQYLKNDVFSMVYYGLTLNSGGFGSNIYFNHSIGGVLECIACLTAVPAMMMFGRRSSIFATLAVSSLSCLLSTAFIHFSEQKPGEKRLRPTHEKHDCYSVVSNKTLTNR